LTFKLKTKTFSDSHTRAEYHTAQVSLKSFHSVETSRRGINGQKDGQTDDDRYT